MFTLGDENEQGTETGDIFEGTGAREVKASDLDTSQNAGVPNGAASGNDKSKESGNASVLNSMLDNTDAPGVLQSMMNHDDIMGAGTEEQDSSLIEYEAERVAEDALQQVRRSAEARREQSVAIPTWTGRSGLAGLIGKSKHSGGDDELGTDTQPKAPSLLDRIKAREGKKVVFNANANNSAPAANHQAAERDSEKSWMDDLINYFKDNDGQCTSESVIAVFRDRVERRSDGAQVFKAMLKRVALLVKGAGPGGVAVWKLKPSATADL